MSEIITDIEKYTKGWGSGLPETKCGSGSTLGKTKIQRRFIEDTIKKYDIKTIADIGAGDLNWIKKTDLQGASYQAYDLIPRNENVIEFNIIEEIAPKADLLLCFWVLNHLPIESSRKAIANLLNSGSRYLMMTDRPVYYKSQPIEIQIPHIDRIDIQDGSWVKLCKI